MVLPEHFRLEIRKTRKMIRSMYTLLLCFRNILPMLLFRERQGRSLALIWLFIAKIAAIKPLVNL